MWKYIRNYIDSLITKDKPFEIDQKVPSEMVKLEVKSNKEDFTLSDLDYKINRKDYEDYTNSQNFNQTNLGLTSNQNSISDIKSKWTFIYSPYFYIPTIIIISIGGGFMIYYYKEMIPYPPILYHLG